MVFHDTVGNVNYGPYENNVFLHPPKDRRYSAINSKNKYIYQIIATSHDRFPPNGGLVGGNP